jgi:hypothetical protein
MRANRHQQFLLGVLGVVLGVAGYLQWPRAASPVGPRGGAAHGGARPDAHPGSAASDVHLEALAAERRAPGEHERNLFKFKPKTVAPMQPSTQHVFVPPSEAAPPAPSSLPPITLKFIGLLERSDAIKVAVLSDGRGTPVHGKEGDAILGQYRILRIGPESIEMSYLDGRGRQTIRLSGS